MVLPANLPKRLRGSVPQTSKKMRRHLMVAVLLLGAATVPLAWLYGWRIAAEQEAFDYLRLNGYGTPAESYVPGEAHFVLEKVLGRNARHFFFRRVSVSMAPEKFTDNMIEQLLAIPDLNRVYLYDRNNSAAKSGSKMVVVSIQEAATPASSHAIARFQRRFPRVEVIVLPDGKDSTTRRRASGIR